MSTVLYPLFRRLMVRLDQSLANTDFSISLKSSHCQTIILASSRLSPKWSPSSNGCVFVEPLVHCNNATFTLLPINAIIVDNEQGVPVHDTCYAGRVRVVYSLGKSAT